MDLASIKDPFENERRERLRVQPHLPDLGLRDIIPRIEIPVDPNLASEFYDRLMKMIGEFDSGLDNEHEVGVRLVSFGQTVVFRLTDLGYHNPSLIRFYGTTENGEPVELIQHVTQISILLMRVKRADPSQPKRPIGFHAETPDTPEQGEPDESAQ